MGEKELADGRFVGLAFSGGGSRAAVFGAAVMKELDRLGVLQQVDVLSAVSGGALPAASYALEGYRDFNLDVYKRQVPHHQIGERMATNDKQVIFSLVGVGKVYPPKKQVLRDIYLGFYYGAKIGVLGLNGSGKSSLLKIIAGTDPNLSLIHI